MIDYELLLLHAEVARHPYPLLFATVSGAHLYGFPSADSDYDLRGAHVLPAAEAVGLLPKRETIDFSGLRDGVEMDMVTHDVLKFFAMVLKRNGYVLEQLYSPLVVHTTPEHQELKDIAAGCVTRHHSHHYLGFAATQWDLFQKDDPPRVKPLLYVYRVLLTGIHLMRTGKVEVNLLSGRSRAVRLVWTAIIPQPISTPTAAGMIAPFVGITLPMVAPIPQMDVRHCRDPLEDEAELRDIQELLARRVLKGNAFRPRLHWQATLGREHVVCGFRHLCIL